MSGDETSAWPAWPAPDDDARLAGWVRRLRADGRLRHYLARGVEPSVLPDEPDVLPDKRGRAEPR